ncbi:metal-dependent phosphohydrolase [Noviherbaspirillum saxi]|uniref:Metal-dependent phosphohydrolase n=2 Tax=Noviherbaspirillum saxi TaxID=2320863 RepID=A0A3A3G0V2_9BURK|nr:metal-dependent phosphohydrolase [Noviherbaspirillum saxi]
MDIQTQSGHYFSFEDPHRNEFSIYDIARSLSKQCRFVGHTSEFYSVAQHCVLASYIVPPEHAYDALMHDAAEAFTGDVSRPLKKLLPDFKAIEKRVEDAVFARFHVSNPLPDAVKHVDMVMLATERRDLMPDDGASWHCLDGVHPMDARIQPVDHEAAYQMFINRYVELLGLSGAN